MWFVSWMMVEGRGEGVPRSRGCVTPAAMQEELPPNQKGYLMVSFFFFCCCTFGAMEGEDETSPPRLVAIDILESGLRIGIVRLAVQIGAFRVYSATGSNETCRGKQAVIYNCFQCAK